MSLHRDVAAYVKCVQEVSPAADKLLPVCRVAASGRFCRQRRGHARLYWRFLFLIKPLQPQILPATLCVIHPVYTRV
jgi:hypothetical protein